MPFVIVLYCVFVLAIFASSVIGRWQMFKKAGIDGWKSIVPVYSTFIEGTIATTNVMYTIAYTLLSAFFVVFFAFSIDPDFLWSLPGWLSVVCFILCLFFLCFGMIMAVRLSTAFGRGAGFAVGLFLFKFVFICIIGFNDEIRYLGPVEESVFCGD